MHQILNEGYSKLVKIWSSMRRLGGHTLVARTAILNKINEYSIHSGKKIHLHPFWILELRDNDGCRRFFKMEDQLEKTSNDYLKFLMTMLDPNDK